MADLLHQNRVAAATLVAGFDLVMYAIDSMEQPTDEELEAGGSSREEFTLYRDRCRELLRFWPGKTRPVLATFAAATIPHETKVGEGMVSPPIYFEEG
jgi:hypothetical protein